MVLNIVALACVAGAIVAAPILFRRHVARGAMAGGAAPVVCLSCHTPADALTSFTCPGCGRDVREAGLGPRGRPVVVHFWTLVVYTFAYLLAATVGGSLLSNALPKVHRTSRNTTMTLSSPEIRGVEMFLDGKGRDEQHLAGMLTGEMYGAGGVVTLELPVPGQRWRLLDATGQQLDAGDRLDGKVVYRWMELAGAPTDTPVAHSDAAHIAAAVGQLTGTRLEMPPVPRTGRALSLSYSSSSGGGYSVGRDPRWAPLLAIVAAAVWLGGVQLILLSYRAGAGRPAPGPPLSASEGVAP